MKNARQEKILEIICEFEISTQEALIQKLSEYGFYATQTTISRDIRELNLIKGPTGSGTYKYVVPGAKKQETAPIRTSAFAESVVKVEAAQNLIVVKTESGMANAVAVCIDSMNFKGLVGSVAGDDTVLLVFKTSDIAYNAEREIKEIFAI